MRWVRALCRPTPWPVGMPTFSVASTPSGLKLQTEPLWSWPDESCPSLPRTRSSNGHAVIDDVTVMFEGMPGPDEVAVAAIRARADRILRPTGALARLDEVA